MYRKASRYADFDSRKKTAQLKTALREVYAYVLKGISFQKAVYLLGVWPKFVYLKVTIFMVLRSTLYGAKVHLRYKII